MVTEGTLPRDALRQVEQRLTAAGCPDADFDAAELLRLVLGVDVRLAFAPLTAEQAARLEELTARRADREPLQYLCGSWPFLDFELAVGPGVLCPRADSEVVCETAIELLQQMGKPEPRVLDLCAGSGCLGLAVKSRCPADGVTVREQTKEFVQERCRTDHAFRQKTLHALQESGIDGWRPVHTGRGSFIVPKKETDHAETTV